MDKRMLAVLALVALSTSCVAMMNTEEREKIYGKSTPIISASYASRDLLPGDSWKIYLKASDPDGDMTYIVATLDQAGMGVYPVGFTRIKAENRKELSGYVYLNTMAGADYTSRVFYDLTLTLQIRDRSGHYSKPLTFPLAFQSRATGQEAPPLGAFQEQNLGAIMITLRTMSAENDGGGFRMY